jgi:hypothetical protein
MRENDIMSIVDDKETKLAVTATEVAPLGYGNPESKISYAKQMESGELTEEIAGYAAELIRSGECMQDITEKDDGCIDGRPAIEILFVDENGNLATRDIVDASNHERAKVAGGGYMTTLAMKRALDVPAGTVDEDLAGVVSTLTREKVYCGAHTGQHGHDDATDCGANDRFQPILQNGILYRQQIGETTDALLGVAGVEYDATISDKVLNGWSETLTNDAYFAGSTGASRFTVIEQGIKAAQEETGNFAKPVAVSKHLKGDHKEDFVVINYIEGKTFSQRLFADKMREKFPNVDDMKLTQTFVVDVPRIVELAQAFTKERDDSEEDFKTALYAGVMYQLATAATLTDGSLPNYIINE